MQEKKLYTTVDILIPCHNRATDIKNLINHLYSIECPENIKFSIHVIDDLSSDNSVETIKNLQKKYSSLFLIQNEANKGIFFNRSLLINNSNADYIFFMDDDDDVEDNLFIEFAKYTDYDLVRTIRKFITNDGANVNFESIYSEIKKPIDMINLMNLYFVTGIFISRYVYSKVINILNQSNVNYLNLNIYDDQPYFYLIVNFTRSFIFINCYYYYVSNPNGLIQSTNLVRTANDSLRIWKLLNNIVGILKKNNLYSISPEFMLFRLWHLTWVSDRKNNNAKFLYQELKRINFNQVCNKNIKNKLKLLLLKNYLTFWLITLLVKPFLKVRPK